MSLDSFDALVVSIRAWLARPGDETIPVEDMIRLFEADCSRKLRTHWQETTTDIATVAGTASYPLPTDFMEARQVTIANSNPTVVLDYMPPQVLDDTWSLNAGQPMNYTIEGLNYRLGPVPDNEYTIRFDYFAAIPALSSANQTNWLLVLAPDGYLTGSLAAAELYLGSDNADTRVATFVQNRELIYQEIRLMDRKFKAGSSPLLMRADPRIIV